MAFLSESEKESDFECSAAAAATIQQLRPIEVNFFFARIRVRPNRLAAQLCGERGSNTNDGPSDCQLQWGKMRP